MQSTPSKLYILLIGLVGLVGGYIVYSQWLKPLGTPLPPPLLTNQDSLTAFKNLKIDFSVLDNAISQGLIISGESPVNPGVTGKKDIFAP
jgi:hypothetical protein